MEARKGMNTMKWIAGTRKRGLLAALVLGLVLGLGADLSAQVRPDVQQLLGEGLTLYKEGKLDSAQQKFEKALMLDITSEEALAWVEEVGYHQLVNIIRDGNPALESQVSTLLELTALEARRRESDPAEVSAALDGIFSAADRLAQSKAVIEAVNTHGVYLLPGLVARVAEADQPTRVRAILTITRLADDAVLPLTRVLQSTEVRQVQGAIGALQHIGNPAAIPSLLLTAESHPDALVREEAKKAAMELGASGGGSAYDALVAQANTFYNDSAHMTRTYHDPLLWTMSGDELSHRTVDGWALNELRAEQLIGDAIALDAAAKPAHVLHACNLLARYSEYRDVRDVIAGRVEKGELEESRLAELRARELQMEQVKSAAYTLPASTLLAALGLALDERRPQVAIELIEAVRSFQTPGHRAEEIPAELTRALTYDHRGVRFVASEAIAHMNPRGAYASADEVLRNLNEGLVEAGRRVALTIFPDTDDALHVAALLERAGVDSFNDESAIGGLQRAFTFPKDLIVISPGLPDVPTAEVIRRLREDYRTRHVPILVVSEDDAFAENQATYASEEDTIVVVNRSVEPLRLRDDLLAGVLSDELRERDLQLAARAAETIQYLAARDTSFDLSSCGNALVRGLENPSDEVRIPACKAIASLGVEGAGSALVRICQEGDANSVALRIAAYNSLGSIYRGKGTADTALTGVLKGAADSSEVQLQLAAARAIGMIGLENAGPVPAVSTNGQ